MLRNLRGRELGRSVAAADGGEPGAAGDDDDDDGVVVGGSSDRKARQERGNRVRQKGRYYQVW